LHTALDNGRLDGDAMNMNNTEKMATALALISKRTEGSGSFTEAIGKLFENLNVGIEDWKVSMEESRDGTRIFVRFQIHVKM
jgi:hypothetical protein